MTLLFSFEGEVILKFAKFTEEGMYLENEFVDAGIESRLPA